jgi:hypothetical protein
MSHTSKTPNIQHQPAVRIDQFTMLIMPFQSSKHAVTAFRRVSGFGARGGGCAFLHVASRPSNHLLINSTIMNPAISIMQFRSPIFRAVVPSSSALSTEHKTMRHYDGPGNNLVRPYMFDAATVMAKGLILSPKQDQQLSSIIMMSDPR